MKISIHQLRAEIKSHLAHRIKSGQQFKVYVMEENDGTAVVSVTFPPLGQMHNVWTLSPRCMSSDIFETAMFDRVIDHIIDVMDSTPGCISGETRTPINHWDSAVPTHAEVMKAQPGWWARCAAWFRLEFLPPPPQERRQVLKDLIKEAVAEMIAATPPSQISPEEHERNVQETLKEAFREVLREQGPQRNPDGRTAPLMTRSEMITAMRALDAYRDSSPAPVSKMAKDLCDYLRGWYTEVYDKPPHQDR